MERRRQIEQRMALGDAKEEARLRCGLQKKAPRQPKADFLRKRSKVNLADLSSETDEEESGSSKSEIPRTASPRARKGSRASASTQPKRRREKRGDALDSDSDAPPRKARSQAGSEPYKPCQRKGDTKVSFQCFPAAEDTDEEQRLMMDKLAINHEALHEAIAAYEQHAIRWYDSRVVDG